MDESAYRSNLQIQELNLIDVSFEDDSLIDFTCPLQPPFSENQEQKHVRFLDPFDSPNVEATFNSLEEGEQGSRPLGSSEQEKGRSGKCNLRKSLAWDSAFFTSEGFLEPEELSSMIGGTEKSDKHVLPGIQEDIYTSTDSLSTLNSDKHVLPGIQEDIYTSTDSLSTLNSDTLTLKSHEGDLFQDVRASIQKSSKMSNVATSNCKKKLGVAGSQTIQSSKKVDLASRDKMTPKAALKRPSVGTQGSGKATKQVSVRPQASQPVATNGETTRSPSRPPKVVGRISPISTISTKRASLGANRINLEKDNSKTASVRGAPAPKVPSSGSSRNLVPRPTPPSRSLHSSAATKTQLTTSCSSLDSSGSGSSGSTGKFFLNSMRRNDSGTENRSSSSTGKSLLKSASRNKSQSGSSHFTAYLRSATNLSSSISPASSISEWSSESTSSTATAVHKPKSTRTSLESNSSTRVSINCDAPQVLDSPNNLKNHHLIGDDPKAPVLKGEHVKGASMGTSSLLCPASSKPSGLRMPSPKIGFFDGVRSAVCTPPGSLRSHSSLPNALPRIGAASISPNAGSNKAKPGKCQSSKSILDPSTQQTASTKKLRPSLSLQAPSNATVKVPSVSRNVKSPLISPKFHSRMCPKTDREMLLKAGEAASKVHDINTLESPLVLQNKISPESKGTNDALGMKFNSMNKSLDAFGDLGYACDAENINPSQKVIEDVEFGQHFPKNDLCRLTNTNERERAHVEGQVNDLSRLVGAIDINVNVGKTVASRSLGSMLIGEH